MAKVELTLELEEGKFETFKKDKIKARRLKDTMKMQKKIDASDDPEEQLELMIEFVVDLFENKGLTEDKILDGLESEELIPALRGVISDVMGVDENGEGKQ